MIRPKYYYSPTLLKDVLEEYNNITENPIIPDEITPNYVSDGKVFGIQPKNEYEAELLYNVVKKYQYSEIGFDVTEIFIDRFKAKHFMYSRTYTNALSVLHNANPFSENETQTKTGEDTKKIEHGKTVEKTLEYRSGETTNGTNEEYSQITRDTNATLTRNGSDTNTEEYGGEDNETVAFGSTLEINKTKYDIERLDFYARYKELLDEYVALFSNLFMGVFTQL